MAGVTLYHAPQTRSGGIVWLLEELGVAYDLEIVDLLADGGAPESYRAIHPNKKVPAIVHRGVAIHERAAICIYLCDTFPRARLAPPVGDERRGPYLTWLVYNDAVIDPVLSARFAGWEYDKRGASFGGFEDMAAHLNKTLERSPYLLGDSFSAADLMVTGGVNFAVNVAKTLPATPAITGFLERCYARDAFKRSAPKARGGTA